MKGVPSQLADLVEAVRVGYASIERSGPERAGAEALAFGDSPGALTAPAIPQ